MPEMEHSLNVREATEEDYMHLLWLGAEAYKETKVVNVYDYNPNKVAELVKSAMESDRFIVLVLEIDGKRKGFLLGFVNPVFFGDEEQATCIAWYIQKGHRGYAPMLALIKAFEEWAAESGAKWVSFSNVKMSARNAFKKVGYFENEVVFTKEIN